jgi:nucleotide-binding universal stress UspA family protein
MIIRKPQGPQGSRILFVWDGTDQFISAADAFLETIEDRSVHAVHAMPHESIYAYGSVNRISGEKPRQARRLEKLYRKQTSRSQALRDSSFEILFGERISEITILASQLRAKFIVTPRFEQSTFSIWLHGDLNENLAKKASCPVIVLQSKQTVPTPNNAQSGVELERS